MISAFKRKVALTLAIVFILHLFSSVFIYADFIINNEYIASVLCINKEKPEMHCNGKCHLGKELAKEAANDKTPFSSKTSKTEIPQVIISENISEFLFATETEIFTSGEVGYKPVFHISSYTSKILHPPRLG